MRWRHLLHLVVGPLALCLALLTVVPAGRIRRRQARAGGLPPRVFWGPVPVVNIAYAARADRLAGNRSESVVLSDYAINASDTFDRDLSWIARVRILGGLSRYGVFLWAVARHDVFCLYFDGGVLGPTPWWRAELSILRLARKVIVVYPYGGDARIASLTREIRPWNAYSEIPPGEEDRDEADVRARLAAFGQVADVVLGCADLAEHLPRVDGMFRFPCDLDALAAARPRPTRAPDDGEVVIAHAPNHRRYKGTRFLLEAVEQLRAEGLPVRLELVEGMERAAAHRVYADADILADQFLIGAYALFAIEGMALGKPVVCFLNDRFARWSPEWEECPLVSASPDDLVAVLRRLVVDPALRADVGARGPAYVRRWHALERVGADMDAIYRAAWP